MTYYWHKYENKVMSFYDLLKTGYPYTLLLKHGIVERITGDHGEVSCILVKGDKYKIITFREGNHKVKIEKKRVSNLTYRGWKIAKYFGEKEVRKIDTD